MIVFYLLRYLPPKTNGEGEIVAAVCTPEWSLEKWREAHPNLFEKPGFYSLMKSTGETMTVEPPKEEKK